MFGALSADFGTKCCATTRVRPPCILVRPDTPAATKLYGWQIRVPCGTLSRGVDLVSLRRVDAGSMSGSF